MSRKPVTVLALLLIAECLAPGSARAVTGPTAYDFEPTMVGSQAQTALPLVAEYEPPATGEAITGVSVVGSAAPDYAVLDDGCTASTLPAGCHITIGFSPSGVGPRLATLRVFGESGTLDVQLRGQGYVVGPRLDATPRSIDFGASNGGLSRPQAVVVTNTGDLPLTIGTVSLTGAPDFFRTADDCSRTVLAPGSRCSLIVRFLPERVGRA
jgi:hypothetical protein